MKIYIDTADINEIREATSWGIVSGITTNPSLIKKAFEKQKKHYPKMDEYIERIFEEAEGKPVSLEVIGTNLEEMIEQGKILNEKFGGEDNHLVVKIPINPAFDGREGAKHDGLKAIKELDHYDIDVNATLTMTPEQGLLAAEAGARYVSPFAGRIDDLLKEKPYKKLADKNTYFPAEGYKPGKSVESINDNGIVSGVNLVGETVEMVKKYDNTEVIAASIRNPRQAREVALAEADIATIPFKVLDGMLYHEKTEGGMKKFDEDVVPEYAALFE